MTIFAQACERVDFRFNNEKRNCLSVCVISVFFRRAKPMEFWLYDGLGIAVFYTIRSTINRS